MPAHAAISLVAHGLAVGALLLVPGVVFGPRDGRQDAVIKAEAPLEAAPEPPIPVVEPPPPVPADAPPAPVVEEPPREEPPPFDEEPDPVTELDTLPPKDVEHLVRPRPPVIAVERKPEAAPPPRPVPREPAPAAKPAPKPRRTWSKAVPKRRPDPEYPQRAAERGMKGRVVLLAEVLPDGTVGEITVKTSSGHSLLDRAAIRAVRKWHFRAAQVNGQPVKSLVEIPFRFDP